MKNIFLYGILFCLLQIILGCTKVNDDPLNPSNSIVLLFPINDEIVDYCCFTFAWESSNVVSDYQLTLSEDENFETIILDTITETLSYYQHQKLRPGRKYFWKVSSNQLQSESVDSFYTKDYLAYFQGSYMVDVLIQDWNFQQGVIWDTMFVGNLVIEKITEEIVQAHETTTGKGRKYSYNPYLSLGENRIVFLYEDASRSSFCTFNYGSNTFVAYVIEGGVGSRTIYSFTGKKE